MFNADEYNRLLAEADRAIKAGRGSEATRLMEKAEAMSAERRHEKETAWRNAPAGEAPVQTYGRPIGSGPTAAPEYSAAMRRYIQTGGDAKLMSDTDRATLSNASDGGGGYTVPAQEMTSLLARLPAISAIFGLCTSFNCHSDSVEWPRMRRNTTSGFASIYTSLFVGSWSPELPASSVGNNEPSLGKFKIQIEKVRAFARLTRDLVDDSEFDLMAQIAKDGALNMGLLREYAIIAGTGVGSEPLGIKNMPTASATPTEEQILTVNVAGTTANTISNSLTDLGSAPKLFDLFYSLPIQYRASPSCRWVMNSATAGKVRKLTDATGRFLWADGLGAAPDSINGKPVEISEFMDSDGSAGKLPILFGDLSQIIVPVRRDISLMVAPERYIDTDEIGLFLSQRLGVGVANRDAFRFGVV